MRGGRAKDADAAHRAERALYPEQWAEPSKALELEDFFDEEAGYELRRAAFYEQRADPDHVSALLTTGQGGTIHRLFRVFMSLPGAMVYAAPLQDLPGRRGAGARQADRGARPDHGRAPGERLPRRLALQRRDLTAAALLFPPAWPAELQYRYPDPPDLGALKPLAAHPAVDWIAEVYRRHRGSSMEVDA